MKRASSFKNFYSLYHVRPRHWLQSSYKNLPQLLPRETGHIGAYTVNFPLKTLCFFFPPLHKGSFVVSAD